MKKIGIVTDSHSSISQDSAGEWGVKVLPMPFYIDGECYYEDMTLTREAFFEKQRAGAKITTSQPTPTEVMDLWDEALKEYEKILYMPLSSGLSGACATAMAMAQDEKYEGRVLVVDHGRVSSPLQSMIKDAFRLIDEGYSAEEIREILENCREDMRIYIAVDNLKYLKEGGRVTPAATAIGTVLKIKPILSLSVGLLGAFKKCRGMEKAKKEMLEAIRSDLETYYKEPFENGEITMLAATSATEEETKEWVAEIEAAFPGHKVLAANLSLGISCHTGAGALGVGFSRRAEKR